MPKLVIVESPTKAKTIGGFLPKDYIVKASMGHIRDLPASASEVPAKVKGEHDWWLDALGQPSNDPAVLFTNPPGTILPLGGLDAGHKGYALAIIVEAMTSGLAGYGKRYPWAINEAKGITYKYDPKDFPVAQMLCESYTNVHSIHPPNGLELNEKVVAAFHKVFANLGEVMDHADDTVQVGFDGRLYGVG